MEVVVTDQVSGEQKVEKMSVLQQATNTEAPWKN